MYTSVVFRLAIRLPRSADTELGLLINKPKQNRESKKMARENISTMFSKWEIYTEMLTDIRGGEGVLQTTMIGNR